MKRHILPLTYKENSEKKECLRRCFDMAKQIGNQQTQSFVLAGMLVFADKIVNEEDSRAMKEWIMMTKVARLFEEEKLEYGKELLEKAKEENDKMAQNMARKLLAKGMSVDEVADVVETLSKAEIRELAKNIQ